MPEAPAPPLPPAVRHDDDGGDDNGDDPKVVLDVLQKLAAQELDRSERFSSRARQAFAFAAGFFAVVQTVAFNSFAQKMVSPQESRTVLTLAIVAGATLMVCGVAAVVADALWKTKDLSSNLVLATANKAQDENFSVAQGFASLYATVLDERRATNGKKKWAVLVTQTVALIAAAAVLGELIYALNARI